MRTREALTALIAAFGRRVAERAAAAARLITARRARPALTAAPRLEDPSFVMAVSLALAVAAVGFLDPLLIGFRGGATGAWRSFLKTLTGYGEGIEILVGSAVILVVCLAVSLADLRPRIRAGLTEVGTAAAFAFVSVAGSGLAASLIKNTLGRARPDYTSAATVFDLHPFAFSAKFASFPSGHSTTAGASAMVLALLFPRLGRPILLLGAAVAISRILLDAHFPSDVVAGFGFGAATALVLARRLAAKRLVFAWTADGRLVPKRGEGPGRWPEVLEALIVRAKRQTSTTGQSVGAVGP